MSGETEEQQATHIAALIRERGMYVLSGDSDRAAQVTAELQRLGSEAAPPPKRRAQHRQATAADSKPRRRVARPPSA
jgi:hypothetical protein